MVVYWIIMLYNELIGNKIQRNWPFSKCVYTREVLMIVRLNRKFLSNTFEEAIL